MKINRLRAEKELREVLSDPETFFPSFKPKICKKSEEMVQKRQLNQSLLTTQDADALNLSAALHRSSASRNHDMSAVLQRSQATVLSHDKKVAEARR